MKKQAREHKRTDFRKFKNLSPENRESAVQMVDAALREHGIDYEQRDRLRLLLEKTLLAYSEIDENAPLRIITHRTYKRLDIQALIKAKGMSRRTSSKAFPSKSLCAARRSLRNGCTVMAKTS